MLAICPVDLRLKKEVGVLIVGCHTPARQRVNTDQLFRHFVSTFGSVVNIFLLSGDDPKVAVEDCFNTVVQLPFHTVADNEGRYVGIILVPEIHRELPEETTAKDLVHFADTALLPGMNVREAMKAFSAAEADALAVIDNPAERNVIGLLTEQHALRRYNEELDRRQNEGNPYT